MTASRQGSATSDFVGGLQNAIQKNPVSAALIGMGVLWMFTGGRNITAAAALFPAAAKATAAGAASGLQRSAELAGDATPFDPSAPVWSTAFVTFPAQRHQPARRQPRPMMPSRTLQQVQPRA